jgi:hypothetical protein
MQHHGAHFQKHISYRSNSVHRLSAPLRGCFGYACLNLYGIPKKSAILKKWPTNCFFISCGRHLVYLMPFSEAGSLRRISKKVLNESSESWSSHRDSLNTPPHSMRAYE